MEENISEAKMLRGEEYHDRSMAEERIGLRTRRPRGEKHHMGGGARPGSVPRPEEEDATLRPRAISMTGIEAEERAEGWAGVFGPARQRHINGRTIMRVCRPG